MKKILILGGGFGGVAAALEISKHLSTEEAQITLIDRSPYHVFTPSLYEVATNEEPQKNIAIPFNEIFPTKVQIINDLVAKIDPQNQLVLLSSGQSLGWDYLVIALGSQPAFFGVPGLEQFGTSLKTINDAVIVENKIEQIAQTKLTQKQLVKIIVGGGGFSGVELAAELTNMRGKLAKKYQVGEELIQISVIEGMPRLLNGLDEKISIKAKKRLESCGVVIFLGTNITQVAANALQTKDNVTHPFDLLIWTGGVQASSLLAQSGFVVNKKGQVAVEQTMQVKGFANMFAIGDLAEFTDPKTTKFAPWVAQVAVDQGKAAGQNLVNLIKNKTQKPYILKHYGYVVPLKGKYALAPLKIMTLSGFTAWVLQQLVYLQYLYGILSFGKMLQRWNTFERELKQ